MNEKKKEAREKLMKTLQKIMEESADGAFDKKRGGIENLKHSLLFLIAQNSWCFCILSKEIDDLKDEIDSIRSKKSIRNTAQDIINFDKLLEIFSNMLGRSFLRL